MASVVAALIIDFSVSGPPAGRSAVPLAAPAAPTGPRMVYPWDRVPSLRLPDGSERQVRSLLNVRRPLRFGDYVWNDDYVPPGRIWVRIDLDRQTLSVFRGGNEIGATVILYGTDGKPTPTGVFPILQKARQHRSTLYDAEMPYMLRLTGDGVAIHASNVRKGAATHGCIGVPASFARLLFDQVRRGDLVAIQRDAPFKKAPVAS
jgi:hypothetical protein